MKDPPGGRQWLHRARRMSPLSRSRCSSWRHTFGVGGDGNRGGAAGEKAADRTVVPSNLLNCCLRFCPAFFRPAFPPALRCAALRWLCEFAVSFASFADFFLPEPCPPTICRQPQVKAGSAMRRKAAERPRSWGPNYSLKISNELYACCFVSPPVSCTPTVLVQYQYRAISR